MEKPVSQQNLTSENAFGTAGTSATAPAAGAQKGAHFVTEGEKQFDRRTYRNVGYIINALLSVVAVAAVERTAGGQKMMENFQGWAERNLKFVKPTTAKMLATKSFFLSGGFAVLAPMKYLEDHKVEMVKEADRNYYGAAADTDPIIVQAHKDLEAAPKQTWGSIFASRALALVPFYAGYALLWDKKSALSKATKEAVFIDKPIVAVSRGIGKAAASLTGNKEAVEAINALNKSHPGEMLSHLPEKAARATTPHDPVHSTTPYYFISEAITSGMVAWGVYALTRVLGPIIGKQATPPKKLDPRPMEIHTNANSEVETAAAPTPQTKKEEQPVTTISAGRLEHQAIAQPVQHAAL